MSSFKQTLKGKENARTLSHDSLIFLRIAPQKKANYGQFWAILGSF